MELTRKEENRNRKISTGITAAFFLVVVAFLAFKHIITDSPVFAVSSPTEFTLGISGENNNNFNDGNKSAVPVTNSEEKSQANNIITATDPETPVEINSNTLADNYRTTITNTLEEENKTLLPEGSTTINGDDKPVESGGDQKFGFDLGERNIVTVPKFDTDLKQEGKVIVEIVVDKDGNVIEANPNGRGTTTSSSLLKARARNMALNTKFSPNPKFDEQRGSITINFTFN